MEDRRYSMLETIRTYAVERLEERGELGDVRHRHAEFFAALVDEAGRSLRRARHEQTLAALDSEADNIRAALEWLLECGELERVVAGAWALLPYWSLRERIVEGRRWFAEARGRGGPTARSLVGEGLLALWGSDYLAAVPLLVESLALARDEADEEALAMGELGVGTLETMRGAEHGVPMIEESRRRFRERADEWAETIATIGLAWGLNTSEADAPLELYQTTVAKAASVGFEAETVAMGALGRRHALRGEVAEAKRVLAAALERTTALQAHIGNALYVDLLADLAAAEGKDVLAARLSTAAEAGAESVGAALPALAGNRAARLRGLRERLGDDMGRRGGGREGDGARGRGEPGARVCSSRRR
jgi:hypothetical protein